MRTRAVVVCMVLMVVGCGTSPTTPATPADEEGLAEVPCTPWAPSADDWSSLHTPRPAQLGALSASPRGAYIYSVATWLEAGALQRQVVRSHDLGQSWCVLPTAQPVAQVTPSRALATNLYAIVGDSGGAKSQLLRSTDGGATWSAARDLPDIFADSFGAPSGMETSTTDPAVLWISATSASLTYVSSDSGETWREVSLPPELVYDPQDPDVIRGGEIIVDPVTTGRVMASGSVRSIFSVESTMLRWFVSDDLGATWRPIAGPAVPGYVEPHGVIVDAGATIYVPGGFRSSDWGATWTTAPLPDDLASFTTLNSREAGRLFAWNPGAGGNSQVDQTVWTTANRGTSWTRLSVPLDPGVDPALAVNGNVIVGISNWGLSSSTNGGRSWTAPAIIPIPGFLQSPVDLSLWGGGTQVVTRGTSYPTLKSVDGGLSWARSGQLSGPLVLDGADAQVAYSGLSSALLPTRTEDGGRTWTSISAPAGIEAVATCAAPHSCLYVLTSTQPEPLFEIECRIARSNDRGRTWSAPQLVPRDMCYGYPHITVAPDDPDHVLAGCLPQSSPAVSAVCETHDGGRTWTPHVVGGSPARTVESIVFAGDGVVLATTSTVAQTADSAPAITARSTDGGATWSDVLSEGGQLVPSVRHPGTVFLLARRTLEGQSNTYSVILRSDDAGATWSAISPLGGSAMGVPGLQMLEVWNIADAPQGGFIASTDLGIVHFQ